MATLSSKTSSKTSSKSTKASARSKEARTARGAVAREKLMNAAMEVLERVGYHQMRVTDVTREAGVAAGLFYHYFDDLKSLTLEALTEFLKRFEALEEIESGVSRGDWYGRFVAHFEVFVENYSSHPGLMRCLLQLSDEEPEFHELHRQSILRHLNTMAHWMPKIFPDSKLAEEEALLMISALSGMSESLLREYYVTRDSALRACNLSDAEMVEYLAVMFYRGLFMENPPEEKLRYALAPKLAQVSRGQMGAAKSSRNSQL